MDVRLPLTQDPHRGQPVRTAGEPLDRAQAALLMLHGRGAQAEDILTLVPQLALPGFACLAPQAAQNSWYPNPFTAPLASNQPWLDSALGRVATLLTGIEAAGIPPERTVLLGFSQGACLALEFAARQAQRYGAVVGFSGALIGQDGERSAYRGSLAGTPVFLGCSEADPYVAKERVQQAGEVLRGLGGAVTVQLYPHMGHTVTPDELDFVRSLLQPLLTGAGSGPATPPE